MSEEVDVGAGLVVMEDEQMKDERGSHWNSGRD